MLIKFFKSSSSEYSLLISFLIFLTVALKSKSRHNDVAKPKKIEIKIKITPVVKNIFWQQDGKKSLLFRSESKKAKTPIEKVNMILFKYEKCSLKTCCHLVNLSSLFIILFFSVNFENNRE